MSTRQGKASGGRCKLFLSKQGCKFGDDCGFLHEKPETSSRPPEDICRDFSKTGRCKFRAKCRFFHENVEKSSRSTENVCRAFNKTGRCKFGENCRYSHEKPETSSRSSQIVCRDFGATGRCKFGAKCRFAHVKAEKAPDTESEEPVERREVEIPTPRYSKPVIETREAASVPVSAQQRFTIDDLGEEEVGQLRNTEITQLERRFPAAHLTCVEEGHFIVQVFPTDPDWPYDVKGVTLQLGFPALYPLEPLVISVVDSEEIPEPVCRVIEAGCQDWVTARHEALKAEGRGELMVRPLLRWLDRELEKFFTEGLKKYQRELLASAAGFEFVKPPPKQEVEEDSEVTANQLAAEDGTTNQKESSESADQDVAAASEALEDVDLAATDGASGGESGEEGAERDQESDDAPAPSLPDLMAERKGTEIKLRSVQLLDAAMAYRVTLLDLMVKCNRCNASAELTLMPGKQVGTECPRCHTSQMAKFRPALVSDMSPIAGYCDVAGCSADDVLLVRCRGELLCDCGHGVPSQGAQVGQVSTTWCRHCHSKVSLAVDTVRLTVVQDRDDRVPDVATKRVKAVRDPGIKLGQSLPDNGTCKHYRRSFRWFRFPCCGKAYPCDVCHEKAEAGDHETTLANRMICGFCSREQPVSNSGCQGCGSALTHQHTAHWEGGRGCRDKIKMSKTDKQKYASINKTVSKKAQEKTKTGPKNTKLRHT